jgi:hypothetical protein
MKPISFVFILLALVVFSCGPSQEELERQRRIEDSLMEIERNNALENADALLQKMDSMMLDSTTANYQ